MATRKVTILGSVGDPRSGVILASGATADLPEVWAERYVSQGKARYADEKPAVKSEPVVNEKPKPTGKKK